MKRLVCFAAASMAIAACAAAVDVSVENAWARATPPGSTVAAVYAQVRAQADDEIVSVTTPSAARVEMHSSTQEDGIMKMRPVTSVPLSANKSVKFEAGGLHLMLIGLHSPLVANTSVALTFNFRSASPVTTTANVVAPGDEPHAH
jgi:periplasmic copper chaperone A